MQSKATSINEYLSHLPAERAEQLAIVRETILKHLPPGYEEAMNWGMITYQVPLSVYPDTYNKQPLMLAALASQKNHMAVYLSGIYMFEERYEAFEKAYRKTGKRFDAGKSCVRFRKIDDLPLELIGKVISSLPMDEFVETARQMRSSRKG